MDDEKIHITPLDEKGDYRLWKIRVEAAFVNKDLSDALLVESNPFDEKDGDKKARFEAAKRKASHAIIHALTDKTLRVLRAEVGNQFRMLRKLDERYGSKTTASKMTDLVSLRYSSLKKDMGTHVDQISGLLEQLEVVATRISNELAVALLVSSMDVPELRTVTAAFKTLADESATWD